MTSARATRVAEGLASIIDAAAGVLAEQSIEATVHEMARALHGIVPYTSLAVYELDRPAGLLVPVFATGRYVAETMAYRPRLDASITGKAVASGELIHLEPGHPWLHRYVIAGTPDDATEAFVVAPLMVAGRALGTLNVWREDVAPTFAPEEVELIRRFATLAAMAYDNARQREQLRAQALTDDLTGLFNRRHFHERLAAELARGARHAQPVALVLLDVDDFKRINDAHGHQAGDAALRAFAAVLREQVRPSDIVCRTGGEEFAVILPGAGEEDGLRAALRLVAAVRAARIGLEATITASAGLAVAPRDADTVAGLFAIADDRLLDAKALGKDRVASSPGGSAARRELA